VIHHNISAGLSTHLANNEDISNTECAMNKMYHNLMPFQNVAGFKFVVMIMPIADVERKVNTNVDAWFASSFIFFLVTYCSYK
jgi:hypothetical protein